MPENKIELIISAKDTASQVLGNLTGKLGKLPNIIKSASLALGGLTAATAGIVAFAKSTANAGEIIFDMSRRTGISAQALSELKYVADLSGTSIQSLETGFKLLSKRMYDASEGQKEATKIFNELGINIFETSGQLKNADSVFMDLIGRINALGSDTEKSAMALELFGRSGTELLPLIKEGAINIEEMRKKAQELGITFTDFEARQADAFNDALTTLSASVEGLKNSLAKDLIPVIISMVDWFNSLDSTTRTLILGFSAFAVAIAPITIVIGTLITSITAVAGIISVLALAITGIAIVALVAWVKAGIELYENWHIIQYEVEQLYLKIKEFMGDKLTSLIEKVRYFKDSVIGFFREIYEKVVGESYVPDMVNGVISEFNRMESGMNLTWDNIKRELSNSFGSIQRGFGNAIGKMIVYGEDFAINFKKVLESILAEFISVIAQMIARWVMFQVLTGGFGAGAGVMKIFGFSKGGVVDGGLTPVNITSAADGGIYRSPTLAMIGDNPERQEAVIPMKSGKVPVEFTNNRDTNYGGQIYIRELSIMQGASIDEALTSKPMDFWFNLVKEKILPALNELGSNGATTNLKYRGAY